MKPKTSDQMLKLGKCAAETGQAWTTGRNPGDLSDIVSAVHLLSSAIYMLAYVEALGQEAADARSGNNIER